MAINQAMAMPKGREIAMPYLREVVESLKWSGFRALALDRHKIVGAAVAPPGERRKSISIRSALSDPRQYFSHREK